MKTHAALRIALVLVACAGSPLAHAETKAVTPVGEWRFETAKVNANCMLSGDMTIWKARDGLACRFIANQSCTGEPPIDIEVAQTCTAKQTGDQIVITSKIDRTVSASPSYLKPEVDQFYAPDNFTVRINKAGDEMKGKFHSLSEAAVRFWRNTSDLVS